MADQDAESVASGLREGQIMTGVYHADVGDAKKEDLHQKWRQGAIKVVCATTGNILLVCQTIN
jgi:ATP-dependent DNA helicase Q1